VAHFSIHEAPQMPEWWRHDDDYADDPQPATAPLDNYDEFLEEVEPAVA
jgi:hypothetical protein